jgi:hypothetical protein
MISFAHACSPSASGGTELFDARFDKLGAVVNAEQRDFSEDFFTASVTSAF